MRGIRLFLGGVSDYSHVRKRQSGCNVACNNSLCALHVLTCSCRRCILCKLNNVNMTYPGRRLWAILTSNSWLFFPTYSADAIKRSGDLLQRSLIVKWNEHDKMSSTIEHPHENCLRTTFDLHSYVVSLENISFRRSET